MEYIKVYTVSLGCPKNLVDTEKLLGGIGKYYMPVSDPINADLTIINTCAFIQDAVKESIETIFEICESVKDKPSAPFIIVTGCLVERYKDLLSKEIPEVDLFLPIHKQNKLPQIIEKRFNIPRINYISSSFNRVITTGNSYAYLKISEGCDHRCNFCVIPLLRGRLISIPKDRIIQEAKKIMSLGIKELILIAQDTTAYGKDLGEKDGLKSLIDELCNKLHNIHWLRLLYMYPRGITEGFLSFLKTISPPFVPYFDVPLQHSHPDILKGMGRPFQIQGEKLIEMIKKYFPDAALRTTFIVGFPGEKEYHFKHLVEFIQKIKFTHVGVFSYSPEEESPSSNFADQVPLSIREERRNILMKIQRSISKEFLSNFKGKEMEIIIDKKSDEWPTLFEGRVWFQAPEIDGKTFVSGPGLKEGKLINATILESYDYDLNVLI